MPGRSSNSRIEQQLLQLSHAGLDSVRLRQEATRLLRRALPADGVFFATADPATLLYTGAVREGLPADITPRFVANEFLEDDFNKFAALATSPQPAASLSHATRGKMAASARFREVLSPAGMGDELRAALCLGGRCWGYLCLHRGRTDLAFSDDDVALLGRVAPLLAEGLRLAVLLDRAEDAGGIEEPGVLLLAEDFSVLGATRAAERWLEEIAEADWPARGALPLAVYAVAARLQDIERLEAPALLPLRARLGGRSGRWLVVHASRLNGQRTGGQIAVVFEDARPPEIAPLILEA